jgi:hypothetical protein
MQESSRLRTQLYGFEAAHSLCGPIYNLLDKMIRASFWILNTSAPVNWLDNSFSYQATPPAGIGKTEFEIDLDDLVFFYSRRASFP